MYSIYTHVVVILGVNRRASIDHGHRPDLNKRLLDAPVLVLSLPTACLSSNLPFFSFFSCLIFFFF